MRFTLYILMFTVIVSCRVHLNSKNYTREDPPGVIKLPNGLMYDETEITNFHWKEYLFWNQRVYGKNSPEYLAALPDTNVWKKEGTYNLPYVEYYFQHPAYRNYPVVGITQNQARTYCNWRTNRVMEYILIRDRIIEWNGNQNRDTVFSIENYFAGKYAGHVPDTNYKYIPQYRLPDEHEWRYAVAYADSVELKHLNRSRKESDKKVLANFPRVICMDSIKYDPHNSFSIDVTAPVQYKPCGHTIENYIYCLRGNVAEWIGDQDSMRIGGSWNDPIGPIMSGLKTYLHGADARTGFRCVCEWKSIKK